MRLGRQRAGKLTLVVDAVRLAFRFAAERERNGRKRKDTLRAVGCVNAVGLTGRIGSCCCVMMF